jgi:hypothetical protein
MSGAVTTTSLQTEIARGMSEMSVIEFGDTMNPEGYIVLLPSLSQTLFTTPILGRGRSCRKERDYPPVLTSIVQAQMHAIKLQCELRRALPIAQLSHFTHHHVFGG